MGKDDARSRKPGLRQAPAKSRKLQEPVAEDSVIHPPRYRDVPCPGTILLLRVLWSFDTAGSQSRSLTSEVRRQFSNHPLTLA